jgi:hypothetical protein
MIAKLAAPFADIHRPRNRCGLNRCGLPRSQDCCYCMASHVVLFMLYAGAAPVHLERPVWRCKRCRCSPATSCVNSHSFATYGLSLGLTFGTLVSGFPGGMQLIVLIGADGAMRSSDLWVRRRFLFPCLRGHAVCLHVFALGTHGPSRKPTTPHGLGHSFPFFWRPGADGRLRGPQRATMGERNAQHSMQIAGAAQPAAAEVIL